MNLRCARALSALLTESDSAQVDIDWIISRVCGLNYSSLRLFSDRELSDFEVQRILDGLLRRQIGEPIAYILGDQGFWSLTLKVTSDTLIPRPDTEHLIDLVLQHLPSTELCLLDLGTGTGAIAISLAKERNLWKVEGVDLVPAAVALAIENAQLNDVHNVKFYQSEWFSNVEGKYHVIVSNPPYIAPDDPHLTKGDVRFEPLSALISENKGLADIELIIEQAPDYLSDNGWLFIEHGYDQGADVRRRLLSAGFVGVSTQQDFAGHDRVSFGSLP